MEGRETDTVVSTKRKKTADDRDIGTALDAVLAETDLAAELRKLRDENLPAFLELAAVHGKVSSPAIVVTGFDPLCTRGG